MEIEIPFEYEKSTKNTYRFQEKTNGEPEKIGTVYLQKHAVEGEEPPEEISVTVEA